MVHHRLRLTHSNDQKPFIVKMIQASKESAISSWVSPFLPESVV